MKKRFIYTLAGLVLSGILALSIKTNAVYSDIIVRDGWVFGTGADATNEGLANAMAQFGYAVPNNLQPPTSATPVTPATPAVVPTPAPTPEPKKECIHEYETEITKEATCKEDGELVMTCKHCGLKTTEVIPKLDTHDYVLVEAEHKDATCFEKGIDVYECSICGERYEEDIPTINHEYSITDTKDATCTKKGEITYTCKNCDDSYVEEIEVKGHDEGTWKTVTESGIFKDGLEIRECNRCGEKLEERVIPSRYPYYYQYILYSGAAFIVVLIALLIIVKNKMKMK